MSTASGTSRDFDEYAATLLRATDTELLLVDDGFPPPGTGIEWERLGELAGCRARTGAAHRDARRRRDVAGAREAGFVALKTIAAYRGGLDRVSEDVVAALEANEATGDPLPVQVHCGFGDADLHLWRADPSYLKPLIERFRETPFVLLHCYPFVREAGWLAHVYGNVWFDLSLTIPHVARPAEHAARGARARAVLEAALRVRCGAHAGALLPRREVVARGARRGAGRGAPAGRGRAGGARDPPRERARAVRARIGSPW